MSASELVITTDRDACMGSGSCSFHAPNTFDLDDECKVVLLDTRDPNDSIRAAADACPTRAISLTERSLTERSLTERKGDADASR